MKGVAKQEKERGATTKEKEKFVVRKQVGPDRSSAHQNDFRGGLDWAGE